MANSSKPTPPDIEQFKKIIKEKGLKVTPQRVNIHEAMLYLGHASADMVASRITKVTGGHHISFASVYNILSSLADLGIYSRRLSSNNKMYFDVNATRHIHLYDHVNNCFRDIKSDDLLELVDTYLGNRKFRGYHVESIDIQIICSPTSH